MPEVVTEEEQFKQWKNEPAQKAFNEKAKSHKIDCFDKAKNYKEITGCWDTPFRNYAKEVLSADSGLVQKIIENLEERYLSNNIYADPSRGISHYVCADEEGNTTGTMSDWKYYYTSENTREQELLIKVVVLLDLLLRELNMVQVMISLLILDTYFTSRE